MGQLGEDDAPPIKLPLDIPNSTSVDFPTKRLARQLVFTSACSPSAAMALPETPLFLHAPPHPSSPLVFSPTPQPVVHSSSRILKPESPLSRGRSTGVDSKDGTPKKQKQCNCKHSKCLKLYCECFASGIYCDGCNCVNCYNNVENDVARREAVDATLERNPNAFRPKIASSPYSARDCTEEAADSLVLVKHNKGCHCKKSGCLKKYCECFQANILCSENCKCMDCKNFEGSEERQALFHGDHTNTFSNIQQAANAAITGAIGSSGYGSPPPLKKRKGHDIHLGSVGKDRASTRFPQFQQSNHIKASSPLLPSIPSGRTGTNSAVFGPSKFMYRSLLADIIQPHDLRELCSVLVVVSKEAAKAYQDLKNIKEKAREEQNEASPSSSHCERGESQDVEKGKEVASDCINRNLIDMTNAGDLSLEAGEAQKSRPMSPSTMALMCDEHDTIFMGATSPIGSVDQGRNIPHGKEASEMYAEQERVVLLKFRDCLNRLISFGEIKETKWSSSSLAVEASRSPLPTIPGNCNAENRPEQVDNGGSSPPQSMAGRVGSKRGPDGGNIKLLVPNGIATHIEVKPHTERGING